jgi:hypothetical protein
MAGTSKEVSADDTCTSWGSLNALVGVLTLTLGIGATSALFRNVEAVLLKPLPYKEASRLRIPPCPGHCVSGLK